MTTLAANRSYRFLFSASAISNLGDGISALAFPWLASLLTRDPFLIAMVAFATRLPWLLLSVPVGVITDRADRRRLMVRADLFRFLLTMGVVGLILSAQPFPPVGGEHFYILALSALAFLLGCAEVVRDNAAQTVLPSIVQPGQLERANGHLWSVEQIMGAFVGPPLAGLLIAISVPAPFLLDAVSFGLAAWLVWCIALPPRVAPAQGNWWEACREGVRWMWQHQDILRLAIMLGVINAAATMTMTILVLLSQEAFGLSAAGHGVLLTAGAVGGVVGGLICPWVVARWGAQRSLHLSLAVMILPPLMIALAGHVSVVALALFVQMLAALLWNVVTVSYRQRHIPDQILGRVNSIYRFFGWGMMPLGALAGGVVVALAEPQFGRMLALRAPFWLEAGIAVMMLGYGLRYCRLR